MAVAAFDEQAEVYDRVRPGYPDAMYADLADATGIGPGARVLEIGAGTGQATVPLANRGLAVTALEPGGNLAALARSRLATSQLATSQLADHRDVAVVVSSFEDWPLPTEPFDLVFSATAFHWVDPAVRYRKSAFALGPEGSLALCWNMHVRTDPTSPLDDAVQRTYSRLAPALADSPMIVARSREIDATESRRIDDSGLFGPVSVRRYRTRVTYSPEDFVALSQTYSDHRGLDAETRSRLVDALADLVRHECGGAATKEYETMLYTARVRTAA